MRFFFSLLDLETFIYEVKGVVNPEKHLSLLFFKEEKKKSDFGLYPAICFHSHARPAPATRVRINKIISHHSAPSSNIFHEKCKKNNLARVGTIYWPSRF